MKKVLIAVVVLGALTLSSCKKDYTCTCSYTDTSGSGVVLPNQSTTINGKKKDVETACEAGSSTFGGLTTTCVID